MRIFEAFCKFAVLAGLSSTAVQADEYSARGHLMSSMSWVEAKAKLTAHSVVVIPVGAESKEHGPHLPLDTDFRQAEYFKKRVLDAADVVVVPTMNYSYYPAFVEYPGSTSLTLPVAREMILDVIRGIAKFGPRRFYVINIGVSTNRPLAQAAALLALEGVLLRYLDLTGPTVRTLERQIETQKEGTHADEIETSIMLAIDSSLVDMKKATVDYMPGASRGVLSLDPKNPRYNASGVYGDATLATVAKGRFLVDGMTKIILGEIEALRSISLPQGEAGPAPAEANPSVPAARNSK